MSKINFGSKITVAVAMIASFSSITQISIVDGRLLTYVRNSSSVKTVGLNSFMRG